DSASAGTGAGAGYIDGGGAWGGALGAAAGARSAPAPPHPALAASPIAEAIAAAGILRFTVLLLRSLPRRRGPARSPAPARPPPVATRRALERAPSPLRPTSPRPPRSTRASLRRSPPPRGDARGNTSGRARASSLRARRSPRCRRRVRADAARRGARTRR